MDYTACRTNMSRKWVTLVLISWVVVTGGCASLQPTDTNGPRVNTPPYPILVSDPAEYEAAALAWQQLSQRSSSGQNIPADLQPGTGTIRAISNAAAAAIFLPKVGNNPVPTEEDIRESLRRFIAEWRNLLGADPDDLSLVERTDEAAGIKTARYEQRPFRYPLRGNFGQLVVRFQEDRRVIDISSTCIPNTDHLQAAISNLTPKVTAETAPPLVLGHTITATDLGGQQRTFSLPQNTVVNVQQLVVYVLASRDGQSVDAHLAWEIDVANGPIKTIYLDAITEQVIATN